MASKVTVHNEPVDLSGKNIGGGIRETSKPASTTRTEPSGGTNVFNGPVNR